MGLFSGGTRIYTATQTLNLVEDTPDVVQQSVVSSLVGNTDIATDLNNTMLNLLKADMKRYYKYGRDHYTSGLPTGKLKALSVDTDLLYPVIGTLQPIPEGTELKIVNASLDTPYPLRFTIHMYLQDKCEYNSSTGELGENPWVPNTGIVDYEKSIINKSEQTLKLNFYYAESINTFEGPEIVRRNKYITVPLDPIYGDKEYYYSVVYTYIDPVALLPDIYTYRHWTYRLGTGTLPTLDTLPSNALDSQFFPVVPLRLNNTSMTSGSAVDTEQYKTARKMLKKIDLSIEELDKGVNENPDVKDIDHAYVVMAIDPRSETPEAAEYLYRFFSGLQSSAKYTKEDFDVWKASLDQSGGDPRDQPFSAKSTPPVNILEFKSKTWDTEINFYYIHASLNAGVMCPVGEYKSTFTGDLSMIEEDGFDYDDPSGGIHLYYQISANSYSYLYVAGLSQTVGMYGAKDHVTTLTSAEEEVILIPLAYDILNQMGNLPANTLCYESLKIAFHAYEKVKLKWYQTGFFKFVIIVVAVAISIYTGQFELVAAAISAGAVATMVLIAKAIVISLAMKYAFKFVADKLGVGFAALVAAVAVAYGLSGEMGGLDLPMADSVLAVTGPMFEGIGEFQAAELKGIQADMAQFTADYESKLEAIKEKWELMDNGPQLFDPFKIYTSVDMPYFESPSQYIGRKTTSNVEDICGYNAIASYVDNALDLTVI